MVVTATVDGSKGDGMVVNMHVCSMSPRSALEYCDSRKGEMGGGETSQEEEADRCYGRSKMR